VLSQPKDKVKHEELKSFFVWALPLFETARYQEIDNASVSGERGCDNKSLATSIEFEAPWAVGHFELLGLLF
jgi:hypothetical protein